MARVAGDGRLGDPVANSSGATFPGSPVLAITPTTNPADYYDNTGISPDDDQTCGNYDGDGYSYSATALAGAGLTPGTSVTAGGLSFTWPNVGPRARRTTSWPPGRPCW